MGDRAQVGIKHGGKQLQQTIYLYSHWTGLDAVMATQKALEARERWDDPEYLTRIILNEIQGSDRGYTGYGIGPSFHGDIEHIVPILDPVDQTVTILDRRGTRELATFSFAAFVTLSQQELEALDGQR